MISSADQPLSASVLSSTAETSLHANLRRLLGLRLLLLLLVAVASLVVERWLDLPLPLTALSAVIGVAITLSALSWWHLAVRARRITHGAVTLQLLFDVGILTAILSLTGGWTNPLVSLFLVPVAAAAALLPAAHTWLIVGASTLAYTAITRFYQPLFDLHQHDTGSGFTLHVTGMWFTFVLSAALLAYFGTSFASTLRRRDRALAAAREANLRNEQIMGVATLAAGTAHELSTPLATIAVVASELQDTVGPALQPELSIIARQVAICREILARLRDTSASASTRQTCNAFLSQVAERFQLLRPAVRLQCELSAADDALIDMEPTLNQAILNLLDNAANVSPAGIEMHAHCQNGILHVDILDQGPGLAFDPGSRPAQDPAATPQGIGIGTGKGMGMGLLLANATIERRGGTVSATPRAGGGSRVRVSLPLEAVQGAAP